MCGTMTVIGTCSGNDEFTTHGQHVYNKIIMCGQMHENRTGNVMIAQTKQTTKNATIHPQPLNKMKGFSHAHETKPVGAAVLMSWARQLPR